MQRVGDFGDTGLEDQQQSLVLRKSPADVRELLQEVVTAAVKLEKRSRTLSTDQLYELQQQFGLAISQIQREIYSRVTRDGK
jgi:hypothetical protein